MRRVRSARWMIFRASFWLWVSPSTTRTSLCLAEIFRIPAWSWRVPSLFTDRTDAFVPIDTSSTVSPARASRVGGGASGSCTGPPMPRSASLSRRRASARPSFTCCQSRSFRFFSSFSSEMARSLAARASWMMERASAWAFSTTLARSASRRSRYSRALAADCSISSFRRRASVRSFSISWRCWSSLVSTSSKRTFSASSRAAAFSMIYSGRPSRREMAKALDFPGMPRISR